MLIQAGSGGTAASSITSPAGKHFTLIGWVIFLLLLYLWSKSDSGYHAIYYGLSLILIFLVVYNYQKIDSAMLTQ